MTSSSIRLSLAGNDVDWTTKTSSPRTFSLISTKTSMSEKRRMLAWVSGRCKYAEMASASGRLLFPVSIFMWNHPSARRPIGVTGGRSGRTITSCHRTVNRLGRGRGHASHHQQQGDAEEARDDEDDEVRHGPRILNQSKIHGSAW